MGMSTRVYGFRPPDEKWLQMKNVWDACEAAKMDVPEEVGEFFDWKEPNDEEVVVDDLGPAVEKWENGWLSATGFQVEVAKIPPNITHIRFENSW
jgi:hypothetical protein